MKTKISLLTIIFLLLLAACAPTPTQAPAESAPQIEDTAEQEPAEQEPETTAVQENVSEEASSEEQAQESGPIRGGSVIRALTSEPTSLDPQGPVGSGQNIIMPFLYDTLVYRDAENNYHPFLAEDWEVSEDGRVVTFTLKEGVTFHDGTPLNAEAVVFTFERFKVVGTSSPFAGGFMEIASSEALDERTVQFTFEEPSATFFGTISMPYAGILSPTAVETSGEDFGNNPVGSGPFMLKEWNPGVEVVLERNPDYAWPPPAVQNKGPVYLDEAVFKVIPDANTQLAALETGEVDVLFVNQPSHIQRIKQNPEIQAIEATLNSLIYLGFNCAEGPYTDVKVRQALAHLVNKDELVPTVLGESAEIAFAPLSPSMPSFDPSLKSYELGYDPEKAQSLLQEAGFERTADGTWSRDGETLQPLLLTSTRAPNGDLATVLQAQFAAVGIPIEIQQLDGRAVIQTATEGNFDLLLWRYDWNDADVLNIYLSSERIGRTNRLSYSNPEVDQLLEDARHELDEDVRDELYLEAQQIILTEAPMQPLYVPKDVYGIRSELQNVIMGAMGRILYNDIWIEE